MSGDFLHSPDPPLIARGLCGFSRRTPDPEFHRSQSAEPGVHSRRCRPATRSRIPPPGAVVVADRRRRDVLRCICEPRAVGDDPRGAPTTCSFAGRNGTPSRRSSRICPTSCRGAVSFSGTAEHHACQGVYALDADLPQSLEARLIGHSALGKAVWMLLFPIFQITRPPGLREIRHVRPLVVLSFVDSNRVQRRGSRMARPEGLFLPSLLGLLRPRTASVGRPLDPGALRPRSAAGDSRLLRPAQHRASTSAFFTTSTHDFPSRPLEPPSPDSAGGAGSVRRAGIPPFVDPPAASIPGAIRPSRSFTARCARSVQRGRHGCDPSHHTPSRHPSPLTPRPTGYPRSRWELQPRIESVVGSASSFIRSAPEIRIEVARYSLGLSLQRLRDRSGLSRVHGGHPVTTRAGTR